MGINKTITATKRKILWKGEVAAEVRAISPHDLAVVLVRAGAELDGLFKAWDSMQKPEVNPRNGAPFSAEEAADYLMQQAPQFIGQLAQHLPKMLADIIAVAADSPEDAQYIQENFPAPLQFDCLVAIAEETFVDPEGFKLFVGKVLALVQVAKGIVSPNANKQIPRPSKRSRNG